jgi:hypothetical protein
LPKKTIDPNRIVECVVDLMDDYRPSRTVVIKSGPWQDAAREVLDLASKLKLPPDDLTDRFLVACIKLSMACAAAETEAPEKG